MSLEEHPAQDDQQHSETEIIEELLRHIPNEIVENISNQNCYENTERIIMFIDVSGFTAMTEMYSKHARIGIDNLSNELNTYFTKIVDHILDNRGDVLKFAGDAILASWPGYNGAIRALQCALDIQRTCSCYKTLMCPELSACSEAKDTCSVIRELNLRIVIASGKSRFQLLQSKTFNHFLLSGDVIDQIKAIENASEIKVVIVSVQFWNILPEHVRDQVMKSIKSSNDTWLKLNISEIPQLEKKRCVSNTATKIINSYDTKFLSKFVIEPVFDKISNLEPLKYASEMRELCICFINLRLQHTDHDNRTSKINKMFDYVCATSHTYEGLMSKVIGFDKGLSFLCLFGLSDATNPYACALETAECVRCWILEDMQEFVDEVSVGVTSGLMYCGVVGHPDRHEYTTIGRKVNLAARLMCNYPDIVTCDQETMLNSKLTMDNFTPLPLVTMKGIQNNVDAFEYHKADQSKSSFLQKENLNIQENGEIGFYGRKIEIMTVCSKLIHFMSKHTGCIRNKRVNANKENQRYALIFKGEDGSGRSSLMRYIFSVLKNGPINREVQYIKCVPTRQISIVSNIGYHGLLNILAKLLNLENRGFEQRKKLYHELKKLRNISFELDFILKEWFQMQDSFVQNTTLDQFISPNKEALKELINLVLNYLQPKQYIFLRDK
ncbi:hypothetical protein GJ496_000524 [Pomphorhynchus laevis]|nr:hypothetical protein GJ496_000524 [Pomphorhynchus laevis]